MTIRWSSLHRLLGLTPQPLTRAIVDQAVEEAVAETSDLDWKRVLPGTTDPERDEFAKDVAAMANSGGGLLVYGVTDDGSHANGINPVQTGEATERRLRALAATRIRPPVPGLQLASLADEDSLGVMALAVPDSPDNPHALERNDGTIRVPYRDGPDTRYMTERQLERAYADRFERRISEQTELERLSVQLVDKLDFSVGAWIVGVARPRMPRSAGLPEVPRIDVQRLVSDADRQGLTIAPAVPGAGRFRVLGEITDEALNPRRGLRRWIVRAPDTSPGDQSAGFYLEVHHDGTVALACRLDWGDTSVEGHHAVPAELAESFAAEMVALAHAAARFRSVDSPMAIRLTIARPDAATPLVIVTRYAQGSMPLAQIQQPPWTNQVRTFIAPETEITAADSTSALQDRTRELALDVLHQFGLDPLRIIPPPA